ncbi:MAG: hypothetical protein ACFFD4_16425 [Candidatus Odinarchaeota archaeon]
MTAVISEILRYTGVEGVFVYNTSKKQLIMQKLPETLQDRQIERFLTTFQEQQQRWMDFGSSYEIYSGDKRTLIIIRREMYKIGCLINDDADLSFIREKMNDLFTRFKLAL